MVSFKLWQRLGVTKSPPVTARKGRCPRRDWDFVLGGAFLKQWGGGCVAQIFCCQGENLLLSPPLRQFQNELALAMWFSCVKMSFSYPLKQVLVLGQFVKCLLNWQVCKWQRSLPGASANKDGCGLWEAWCIISSLLKNRVLFIHRGQLEMKYALKIELHL